MSGRYHSRGAMLPPEYRLGVESAKGFLKDRAAGAKPGGLLILLDNAPDRRPERGDELMECSEVQELSEMNHSQGGINQ